VSAHIKALEDEIGIVLFDRTPRGMSLTIDGASLLVKAEQVVAMHCDFIDEAKRIKGQLRGRLRLGSIRNPSAPMLGSLLAGLSRFCPEVEVVLEHGRSIDIVRAIRSGSLDAGFYAEAGTPNWRPFAPEDGPSSWSS